MAAMTFNQILKQQETALEQVQAQIKAARKPRVAADTDVVEDKEQLLAGLKDRVTRAKQGRQAQIKRIDEEIENLTARASALAAEIKFDRENIGKASKRGKSPAQPPGDKPRPGLESIKGVGKVAVARLEEEGITDVKSVARMSSLKLATVLGTSQARAREIIASAKGKKE